MKLPEEFVRRINEQLGDVEGARLCQALDEEPSVSVRLNPLKTDSVEKLPMLSVDRPIPWSEQGYYLRERASFTFDGAFHGGAYYVQEASSQFVGYLLRGEPLRGKRLLDMCAAPGGKTTLYASLVGEEGLVVANEIDRRRANVLADNVRKWGSANVVVSSCRSEAFRPLDERFDVVAVDAPCSGEGMFRKDEVARADWSVGNVMLCAHRQDEILRQSWQTLRAGGLLIYSTCTFNREEDEASLERMIEWAGDELVEADEVELHDEWGIVSGRVGAFQTFHFYPHKARGEGFFAAVARKAGTISSGKPRRMKGGRKVVAKADKKAVEELQRWVMHPEKMQFMMVGDQYYGWSAAQGQFIEELSEHLPVIYSGVAMGQIFKGRLKPDWAMAMFYDLNREAVSQVELDEEQMLRFLRRLDIDPTILKEGMNLVTYQSLGLGFLKRIGQRANNLYPDSLRIIKQ